MRTDAKIKSITMFVDEPQRERQSERERESPQESSAARLRVLTADKPKPILTLAQIRERDLVRRRRRLHHEMISSRQLLCAHLRGFL